MSKWQPKEPEGLIEMKEGQFRHVKQGTIYDRHAVEETNTGMVWVRVKASKNWVFTESYMVEELAEVF